MQVSDLHIYPIKSCRGVTVKSFRLDPLGPLFDRRYMVVDANGLFMSQREHPRLALVRPILAPTAIKVEAKGMPRLTIGQRRQVSEAIEVEIWGKRGPVDDAGAEAADWFSEYLQVPCRLAVLPGLDGLPVDPAYTNFPAYTSFTDGFPLLVLSRASLEELNRRLERPVTMDRFRPNLVIDGCSPNEEDEWSQIRIGDVLIDLVKPCSRCVTVTVDQTSAQAGKEPLATLASYRTVSKRVLFGYNGVHHGTGVIRQGDTVEVIARRDA